MIRAGLVGAAVVAVGVAAFVFAARPATSGWRAVAWPFPRDAWPAGLAYACDRSECGAELRLYLRPKRGFCANCETGVTSDAEVDGVADLDMIADDFAPLAPGEGVSVGDFAGRQRAYTLPTGGGRVPALGLAMTRRRQCDLVVAVTVGAADARARASVAALLASAPVTSWIDRQLDGR